MLAGSSSDRPARIPGPTTANSAPTYPAPNRAGRWRSNHACRLRPGRPRGYLRGAGGAGSGWCATIGSMIDDLVGQIEGRFAELERQMADPELHGDRERAAEVGREYNELRASHDL